jgi:hypothetical protein
VGLFFAALLIAGLVVFDDYGISWDEEAQRNLGRINLAYLLRGDQELLTYPHRFHGPAFQLLLIVLERAFGLEDSRTVYLMRHLVTFLLFYAAVIVFYILCARGFSSPWAGLLASLLLVLHPRIFAHSFYNPKDLPLLSVFIISMYTMTRYLETKTLRAAIAHAAACGILVAVRILGIIVPALTIAFVLMDAVSGASDRNSRIRLLASALGYCAAFVVFVVALWPVLWEHPASQFLRALREMGHYSWQGRVWYMGHDVRADSVPWHYVPVWLSITTPILYTVAFLIGVLATVKTLLKHRTTAMLHRQARLGLIALLWFFVPLVTVIALRSVLYDSWRHMFFIYPGFVILSVTGLRWVTQLVRARFRSGTRIALLCLLAAVAACSVGNILLFMIRNHPHQNVYFNRLAGRNMSEVKNTFELDYWGVSYRQALEYILANDSADTVALFAANRPGHANARILPASERKRLLYEDDSAKATYFVSNYRGHPREYECGEEFFSIKVGGARIMVVCTPGPRSSHESEG